MVDEYLTQISLFGYDILV